uniref:Uncharacterized protein n=1 Tax=Mesocestoides corti TaxID=53468 RepID=A0A5K3FIP1_MESCO
MVQHNRLCWPFISQTHPTDTVHRGPPRWPRRSLYTASHSCPSLAGRMPSERKAIEDWLNPA